MLLCASFAATSTFSIHTHSTAIQFKGRFSLITLIMCNLLLLVGVVVSAVYQFFVTSSSCFDEATNRWGSDCSEISSVWMNRTTKKCLFALQFILFSWKLPHYFIRQKLPIVRVKLWRKQNTSVSDPTPPFFICKVFGNFFFVTTPYLVSFVRSLQQSTFRHNLFNLILIFHFDIIDIQH